MKNPGGNLMDSKVTEQKVIKYLLNMNYKDIKTNFHIYGREIDVVIFDDKGDILGVVEITYKIESLFKDIKERGVENSFHPVVSKAQNLALEVGANFFLVTNGDDFIWFTSDLETGFPTPISTPTFPLKDEPEKSISKQRTYNLMESIRKYVKNSQLFYKILLLKLLSEKEKANLSLVLSNHSEVDIYHKYLEFSSIEKKEIIEILPLLEQLNFANIEVEDFFTLLDEFIERNNQKDTPVVPRWLADFMVKLTAIPEKAFIYDPNSLTGNIVTAAYLNQRSITSTELVFKDSDKLLSEIQKMFMNNQGRIIKEEINTNKKVLAPSHIISFPPIGKRIKGKNRDGLMYSEDIYIKSALDLLREDGVLTLLVSDSLLFSGGSRKKLKEYIQNNAKIKAIISLPRSALYPSTEIKMSIIILQKTKEVKNYSVFMASLEDIPLKDTLNSAKISSVSEILKLYKEGSSDPKLNNNKVIVTDIGNLVIENWTPVNYSFLNSSKLESSSFYQEMFLSRLTKKIQRGTTIRTDTEGDISIIGPANIRALNIEKDHFKKTFKKNLPTRTIWIEKGDILINNIGNYLGAAVFVDSCYNDAIASQNTIVLKPNNSLVNPEYFAIALNSQQVKAQFKLRASGTTIPQITLDNIKNIMIPIPPREIQDKIVADVNSLKLKENQLLSELKIIRSSLENTVKNLTYEGERNDA